MHTPAYIDLALYLPAGGVNGFELNGHAVNEPGFVDSPFAGVAFYLDPYRSLLEGERQDSTYPTDYPSFLAGEPDISVQRPADDPSEVWAPRCSTTAESGRVSSEVTTEVISLALEVEGVSVVPPEYRTAYVLADHPASITSSRTDSEVDAVLPTEGPSVEEISVVPAEDRTSKVRRI